MKSLEEHLAEAAAFHGESCPGQVLGVRLARAGLRQAGIDDPLAEGARKKLIVFVEIDRCAADAIMAVTGCRVGKRSLKVIDYGVMAATFLNLESGRAVRVVAREEARELAAAYASGEGGKYEQQRRAYEVMPEAELFSFEEVEVSVPPEDMPGRPLSRVRCQRCGDHVQDRRERVVDGTVLCRACAEGGYYRRNS
ncbi:MAG: FmdE family protein [Thermoleophilia bacterium]